MLEYVDISNDLDAAVGQNRPAPQGSHGQVHWQPNHGDPEWSKSALIGALMTQYAQGHGQDCHVPPQAPAGKIFKVRLQAILKVFLGLRASALSPYLGQPGHSWLQ